MPDEPPNFESAPADASTDIRLAWTGARGHVWDEVEPADCDECADDPRQFLSHVFALAFFLLGSRDDDHVTLGNHMDGYTLLGAIHAAVQVMHRRPRPYYDAAGNAGPDLDAPLGQVAADYLDDFLARRAPPGWTGGGWDWWKSEPRTRDAAIELMYAAFGSVPPSPSRGRRGQAFLLGAGFSHAVSSVMPTMSTVLETLKNLAAREQWELAPVFDLSSADELESWLDSLATPMPFRSESENAEATALYLRIAEWLGRYFKALEAQAFQVGHPEHLVDLLRHWQTSRSTVVTLNYDTIIERCVETRRDDIGVSGGLLAANTIRSVPLSPTSAYMGIGRLGGDVAPDGFRLAKLHGSIDWQYSGGSGRGQPIYAIDTDHDDEGQRGLAQMVPYIIPPCFTKTSMFDHEVIRQNWQIARRGIRRAEELVVMGYSLPSADTAVVHMLRAHAPDKIVLLDTNPKLKDHYEMLLEAEVEMPHKDNPIWRWVSEIASLP